MTGAPKLPAPRLQFRWVPDDAEPRWHGDSNWLAIYELVLPLREHDIRREDADGNKVRDEIALEMSRTRRGGGDPCPHDTPFRDGCHARWDSELLGKLPIYVLDPDGGAWQEYVRADRPGSEMVRVSPEPATLQPEVSRHDR